jgi:mRNA-degrading endonuclease toxin of MazEF toxin-antitoxin module
MVDFGNPVGTEMGMEHPALIVSAQELNDAVALKRAIVVAGTSTRYENRQTKKVLAFHLEVPASTLNGLHHTTYFMSEQVRTVSIERFRRQIGTVEASLLKEMENKLCLVMKLFR